MPTMEVSHSGAVELSKRQEGCRHLPLEIWTRIVSFITDARYMPRAWLHLRLVSHSLKAATEMAFTDVHLRHTELVFKEWDLGVATRDGHVIWPKVVFRFAGLEDDENAGRGTRAVFERDSPDDAQRKVMLTDKTDLLDTNLFDYSMRRWRGMLEPYARWTAESEGRDFAVVDEKETQFKPLPSSSFPPHVLSVRQVVNDTALPGLKVDFSGHRISVLWRPMASALFGEDEYVKWAQKVESQHSPARSRLQAMLPLVRSGELPFDEFLAVASKHGRQSDDRVLGDVRRLRRREEKNKEVEAGVDEAEKKKKKQRSNSQDMLKLELVRKMQEQAQWREYEDQWVFEGPEEGRGNFYDGEGMLFKGRTETNGREERCFPAP